MCQPKNILFCFVCVLSCILQNSKAQAVLEANGPGNTYELINSILAPGNMAVEAPEQCGNHASFGRHIAEVWDATLNKFVFEFYSHVAEDNDRCLSFDRQRVEIKTYEPSPDNLKGTNGETVTYRWQFRLPSGFQPSANFTHIHQIKAVGGDDDDPIFTLTPRAGTTNRLELIHVPATVASNIYLATVNLSNFLGVWVEVFEQIRYGVNGSYTITIKRVSDGVTLLAYSNNNILTMRADNNFVRPKWGIYRSLNNATALRDDSIRIASLSIFEGLPPAAPSSLTFVQTTSNSVTLNWLDNANNETAFVVERSATGTGGWVSLASVSANNSSYLNTGLSPATNYYYRVKAINPAGESLYSNVIMATTQSVVSSMIKHFSANQKGDDVLLSWSLQLTNNLQYVCLEYSKEGINFHRLDSFPIIRNHNYTHKHLTSYTHTYYRLLLIGTDGNKTYSSILKVQKNSQHTIRVFPNPANDKLSVQLAANNYRNSIISIKNMLGVEVFREKVVAENFMLKISNLRQGFYTLQHIGDNKPVGTAQFKKL